MKYSFKYVYKDGKVKICGGRGSAPEFLCYDFDGQISWDLYDKFVDSNPSIKDILTMAKEIHRNVKGLYRIEIIEVETNEVVDFIEM